MKFLERFKIWGTAKAEKAFNVTETQKAEAMKKNLSEGLNKIKQGKNLAKAERIATENRIKQYEETIKLADKKLATFQAEGNKEKWKIAYEKKKDIQVSIDSLKKTLSIQDEAINKFEAQENASNKQINRLNRTINEIKSQERFADTVSKYNELLEKAQVNGVDMDDIKFNVDVKFNEADLKLKDLEKSNQIDTILDDIDEVDAEEAWLEATGQAKKEPAVDKLKDDLNNL